METNRTSVLWSKVLERMGEELSDMSYTQWIEPIKPVSVEGDRMVLEVPNLGFRDTILNRYNDIMHEALQQAANDQDMSPVFIIPTQVKKNSDAHPKHGGQSNFSLKSRYTFSTFVVGKSNQLARAASMGVAKSPGNLYNPLFLYSRTGLGKTHLMHAIGNHVLESNPDANIIYLTSERFTNDLITSLQAGTNAEFRERYRSADVLLLDDIQFIADKERTQEEFFHTFNTLHEAGKQIVLTSDKPPMEIALLEERLRSRFEMGLIADISTPDYETRVAILLKKAEMDGIVVEDDGVMGFIANRVESNIRELEGSLTRVTAFARLHGKPITVKLAEEALKDYNRPGKRKPITPLLVQQKVCNHFGVNIEDLSSKRRSRDIAWPRQVAMYIMRGYTELSLTNVGEVFGGRDHTTVIHACEKIEAMMAKDDMVKDMIDDIVKDILE